jgi:hypothetical protein
MICDFVANKMGGRAPDLPLLAFAMTSAEESIETKVFSTFVSASLFGNYRSGHLEGIDIRKMPRFSDGSFSAVSGILLFDYFVETSEAVAECFRVLEPGGILFTHVAPNRLLPGYQPARMRGLIKSRPGYFEYLQADDQLPSVEFSAAWFLDILRYGGFDAQRIVILDNPTGLNHDWYIAQKPVDQSLVLGPPVVRRMSLNSEDIRPHRSVELTSLQSVIAQTMSSLPNSIGYKRLSLSVSEIHFGDDYQDIQFAEHVVTAEGSQVVCVQNDAVLVSNDDGTKWQAFHYREQNSLTFHNSFTPRGHEHRILQTRGWSAELDDRPEGPAVGRLYLMDDIGRLTHSGQCGSGGWHGTYSIDQSDTAIIFGEYHVNNAQFRQTHFATAPIEHRKFIRHNSLFRSEDGGLSWNNVLTLSPDDARHFHTVVASSHKKGVWWTSTGDKPTECNVYQSLDDGYSWHLISEPFPDVPVAPGQPFRLQACYRNTAMVETPTGMRWGADDIFGDLTAFDPSLPLSRRTGARFYVAEHGGFDVSQVAYCGHPVRSLIDIGAGYIVLTEAFYPMVDGSLNPEVKFWSKSDPSIVIPLMIATNFHGKPTGFTYSKASKTSNFGTFFSYRGPNIFARGREKILKWEVHLD